jgi:glycosyltransferase involved in cell wall biosynthesis
LKILFFSHYFPPEVNAPATRTYEHCVRWARAGHEVTVVTCAPNCPDGVLHAGYANRFSPQTEQVDGLRVVRVWTYLAPNAGFLRRIVNYLSYTLFAVLAALRMARPDVVVATSPQFFCGWAGVVVSKIKSAPLVLEIRDLWPESIEAVGALRNRPLLKLLEWLERRMYLAAQRIVAVGEGYRAKILEKVAIPERISVITNGVDLERFVPQPPDPRWLHVWEMENKFVCSYIGTIGMAHGLEVVIGAAQILRDKGRADIAFCLVGDGATRKQLEESSRQVGLEGLIRFTGLLPKEEMPGVLASSNACLIHLKKCDLFQTVIPSKLFETMAMERPIILGVAGEAAEIVRAAEAGLEMIPESPRSLAECVEHLADHPKLTDALGRQARAFVGAHYTRDVLAERMLKLLHEAAGLAYAEPEFAGQSFSPEPAATTE